MATRVFYIDNGEDLAYLKKEYQAIKESHDIVADARGTDATYENIFNQASLKDATILHISAHFGAVDGRFGFKIHDTILTDQDILRIAKAINARCVYLNGCGTSLIAKWLIKKGVPAVISNSRNPEVEDRYAWSSSIMFYRELAQNGLDIRLAYEVIEDERTDWESNGGYIDNAVSPLIGLINDLSTRIDDQSTRIDDQSACIDTLDKGAQFRCKILIAVCALVTLMAVGEALIAWRLLTQ